MRINRNMLMKIANDAVSRYIKTDRTLLAVYMQGSLLGDEPLLGNTADIDLFFVHTDDVALEREIVRVSDEVHLDISHHTHMLYRQPRELRVHPWLGPAIYGARIMHDPQHFMDFVQASVRGQFAVPDNVLSRVHSLAGHAREMWVAFDADPHAPTPAEAALYLHALEHAANAVAGLSGHNLTERRFLVDFTDRAEAVDKSGLYAGFTGLLGAPAVSAEEMRAWLPAWHSAYAALPDGSAPLRLHPDRWLYYAQAVEALLGSSIPHNALWPLWRTWTHAVRALPDGSPLHAAWQDAGEQLGLLGPAFVEKIDGLDAYLDAVEELLETWARENGV